MFKILRKKKSWIFIVVLLVATLVILGRRGGDGSRANFIENFAATLLKPFVGTFRWLGVRGDEVLQNHLLVSHTQQEYQALQLKHQDLQARLLWMEEVNFLLQQQVQHLNPVIPMPLAGTFARVTSYDPSDQYQALTINRGSQRGLQVGQAVVAMGGLVGRVVEVGKHQSKVVLLNDLRSVVDVVAQKTRARGSLVGRQQRFQLGRNYWLTQGEYFDAKSELQSGELLLTSGQDGLFPKGIPVGVIEDIKQDRAGLFWQAEVRPYVELDKLETVLVLSSAANEK